MQKKTDAVVNENRRAGVPRPESSWKIPLRDNGTIKSYFRKLRTAGRSSRSNPAAE